jgi:hypothetical protein
MESVGMVFRFWSTKPSTADAPRTTSPPRRPRLRSLGHADEVVVSPRRRINSHDIPRSYSGHYGLAGDLLVSTADLFVSFLLFLLLPD